MARKRRTRRKMHLGGSPHRHPHPPIGRRQSVSSGFWPGGRFRPRKEEYHPPGGQIRGELITGTITPDEQNAASVQESKRHSINNLGAPALKASNGGNGHFHSFSSGVQQHWGRHPGGRTIGTRGYRHTHNGQEPFVGPQQKPGAAISNIEMRRGGRVGRKYQAGGPTVRQWHAIPSGPQKNGARDLNLIANGAMSDSEWQLFKKYLEDMKKGGRIRKRR